MDKRKYLKSHLNEAIKNFCGTDLRLIIDHLFCLMVDYVGRIDPMQMNQIHVLFTRYILQI